MKEKKKSSFINFGNILRSIDIYPAKFQLFMNEQPHVKTYFGGLVSICLISCFLVFLIFLLYDLIRKDNQTFNTIDLSYTTPTNFTITQHENKKTQEIPYFVFFLSLTDSDNKIIKYDEEIQKYLFFEIFDSKRVRGKEEIETPIKLKRCVDIITNWKNVESHDDVYCLDMDYINLSGEFNSEVFQFISIKLKQCKENCETDKDKINEVVRSTKINIHYTETSLDSRKKDQIPLENFINKLTYTINSFVYFKNNFFLSYNQIVSYENQILTQIGVLMQKFTNIIDHELNSSVFSGTYMSLYLRSSKKYVLVDRSYKRFIDLISQLGGLWKFFLIVGVLLVKSTNSMTKVYQIANNLFNILSNENQEKMEQLENLTVLKKNSNNDANSILFSNGKSEIEAHLYIDIYKYQKFSGVNFDIRSYFLDFFKSFFKCCKRQKTSQNDDINKKISENVIKKLDIVKIMKFIKEFKIFKTIFLNRKRLFLKNNLRKDLNYGFINAKLKKKFLQQNLDKDPNEIRRLKNEKKFIMGLRYLKNKPILDPQLDIALLKRYKWDMKTFEEYMLRKFHFNEEK